MDYKSFKKELDDFEKKNKGLISSYNDFAFTPISALSKELHKNYNTYVTNIKKSSVTNFLNTILKKAIDEENEVISVLNNLFSNSYGIDTENESSNNSIQMYFNDVKRIYEKNNNDYNIEFTEENRDKLIEMNLKSVISVAKAFRNLGVPFEDLINAGNLGLCKAFEKYDPERSVIKEKMLELVSKLPDGDLDNKTLESILELCKYGNVRKKLQKYLSSVKTTNKKKLTDWVKANVQNARFNSVAVMWIRAYIIDEINQHSRPVKKPKAEIDKELHFNAEDGTENPYKDKFIFLDEPIGDTNNSTIGEIFYMPDDTIKQEDRDYSRDKIKETLKILMEGVKSRDRRIILQKFGVGYPRELSPKEIAEKESLSVARVCQIVNSVLDTMKKNQEKYKLDPDAIFDALSYIY